MNRMRSSGITHCLDIKHVPAQRYSIFSTDIRPQFTTLPRSRPASQSQKAYSSPSYKGNNRLHGRTALITGGSSGIGYAIAERFLAEGANKVILVGRRHEKLQDASRRLTESIFKLVNQTEHVATRAPEEDLGEKVTPPDSKVEVLVGDITVVSEWMSELEKAMVILLSHLGFFVLINPRQTWTSS